MASTHDFSTFKLRVNVKTSVENAYQAWATSGGLQSWLLGKTVFTDPAGRVRADNEMAQAGDSHAMYLQFKLEEPIVRGKVLKTNGKDLFSFSFANDIPVTITIYKEQDETIVELIESNLPSDAGSVAKQFVSDSKGWVFFLTNLKSTLEGGLDLRNTNEGIRNVITG